jgi:hypothetical protein
MRLPVLLGLAALIGWPAAISGAEYGPKPRQAPRQTRVVARLRGEEEKAGQVVVRLSGELVLTLTVEGPSAPDEPVQPIPAGGDWVVRKTLPASTESLAAGRVGWSQTFHLEPMKKDQVVLPLAPLAFGGRSVEWEPITVLVTSDAVPDLNDLRDITRPEDVPAPEPWLPWWWVWAALGLVLLGLALGGWWLRRRLVGQKPALSPEEWALHELDRLDKHPVVAWSPDQAATAGDVERYHTLLSDVVRRYLELRLQLHAPRQTTAEFLEAMRHAPQLRPEQQAWLREFLERCDLVKFARAQPAPEECRVTAGMARSLVLQAAPAEALRI